PSEVLRKGDVVKARITNIDVPNQRVSLSIKEFLHDEWDSFVADHRVGDTLEGKVVNVTDFGLFIDIYNGLEGLAHVSEIDVPSGARLEDHFRAGDWVRARILRIEDAERRDRRARGSAERAQEGGHRGARGRRRARRGGGGRAPTPPPEGRRG